MRNTILRTSTRALYAACLWGIAIAGLGLYFLARYRMNPALCWVVCLHALGGTVLGVPFLFFAIRKAAVRRRQEFGFNVAGIVVVITGTALLVLAAIGESITRAPALYDAHVWAGIAATGLAAIGFVFKKPPVSAGNSMPSNGMTTRALILFTFVPLAGLGTLSYHSETYFRAITATNARQAGNPSFPSGALIHDAGRWEAEECGKPGCHPKIHTEWMTSPHARSAQSALYVRETYRIIKESSPEGARWCQGCHMPLAGAVKRKQQLHSSITPLNPNIGCRGCHAMNHASEATGNGRTEYFQPPIYKPFGVGNNNKLESFLIRLRPMPHIHNLRGPEGGNLGDRMCAPCHRMSVRAAQNHYRFVRTDDTWAEWQAAAISGNTLHSDAPSGARMTCVDCHLGHGVGHVIAGRSNLPADANAAPRFNVEVFALRRAAIARGAQERIDAPLATRQVMLDPGDPVSVDVLVSMIKSGHSFPQVAADRDSTWLAIEVSDQSGKRLLESGSSLSKTPFEEAHSYRTACLDCLGHDVHHYRAQDTIAVAYRNQIKTDSGDVVRYRFSVPKGVSGTLAFTGRLSRIRHSGLGDGSPRPEMLAEHTVRVGVRAAGHSDQPLTVGVMRDDPKQARSFRKYGYALLDQRDTNRARRAFQQAAALAPGDPENWIATARANLDGGDLLSARENLNHALRLSPGSPRVGVWLGRTYRLMGQFEEALKLLEPLAQSHPTDSDTWLDMGLCFFSMGRYQDAIEPFAHMLEIDPDNEIGHFNLMQCYRKLRRISDARREEAIYRVLHLDAPPAVLSEYLQTHPDAARESQGIHEHTLSRAQ